MTALRPIIPYLEDPDITEVMLNADGAIWIDHLHDGMSRTDVHFPADNAMRAIRVLATTSDKTITLDSPSVAATLPRWHGRFQASIPPIVTAPIFTIRKPASVIYTLADYVHSGILTASQAELLIDAVGEKLNIVIAGGTGSGKTTLANALLQELSGSNERIYIVEDRDELQCAAPNRIEVLTSSRYSMRQAIFDGLRHNIDRFIIGEVRDGAALELLKAWETGHPGGVTTVHANSAQGALDRLCRLIEENNMAAPRDFVAETVDLCVHIRRDLSHPSGRVLTALVRVDGYAADAGWACTPVEPLASLAGNAA